MALLALTVKLLDRENWKKKEKGRKVKRGKWPAGKQQQGPGGLGGSLSCSSWLWWGWWGLFAMLFQWHNTPVLTSPAITSGSAVHGEVTWLGRLKWVAWTSFTQGFQAVLQQPEPFLYSDRSQTDKLKTTPAWVVFLLYKSYFSGLVYTRTMLSCLSCSQWRQELESKQKSCFIFGVFFPPFREGRVQMQIFWKCCLT